jgi:glycosyltransferase involved in cell wall biosynthesis
LIQNHRLSHVLVIAPEKSASLALVATYPLGELDRQGVLKLRVCTAKEATGSDLAWCDILFAVRPANAAMAVLVTEAKRMGRIVMCHWDDDLLSIPKESSSYAYFARPGVRTLTLATLLHADVVLSSSEYLGQHLRTILDRHGKSHTPALVLPVPALAINPTPYYSTKAPSEGTPFTIGYAGSSDQTAILQSLIVPALELLWQQGKEIHLQLIGPTLKINPRWQKFVSKLPFTEDYESWLQLRNNLKWDAALAPLPGDHFCRCKFFNKFLEFAAAGIPCLYSDIPPFSNVISDLKDGVLVKNTPEAWQSALDALADNNLRETVARGATARIISAHSLDGNNREKTFSVAGTSLANRAYSACHTRKKRHALGSDKLSKTLPLTWLPTP